MAHSNATSLPKKPREDFPLFVHATDRWAKKVRGKLHYFGKASTDPKGAAAEELWNEQKDDLYAGRTPRAGRDGATVKQLCDRFCSFKEDAYLGGEITKRSFNDYVRVARLVADGFGRNRLVDDLAADDFEALRRSMAKRMNVASLGNEITRIRVLFKFGFDSGLIDRPVRYGASFNRPAKRALRLHRQRKGKKMLEARDIRRLLKAAPVQMRAMIYLAVNCGFGNSDCGNLPRSGVDLKRGWVDFPRPKTGVERRAPLWPETVAALKAAIAKRPKGETDATKHLIFVTSQGQPWAKETSDSPISKEFRKLLNSLRLHRKTIGFYTLRHVFETVAGEGRDQVAVDHVMGHDNGSMAGVYREKISDGRLIDCVNVVRKWLFRRESATPWRAGAGKAVKHGG